MKNKTIKRFLAGVTALLLGAVTLSGCSAAATSQQPASEETEAAGDQIFRTLDEIKSSGTINIGVFSDKNPFGYVDENGNYQGYDVYFAESITDIPAEDVRAGRALVLEEVPEENAYRDITGSLMQK